MKIQDIIVLGILIALVILAIRFRKGRGGCCGSGGCASCSGCDAMGRRDQASCSHCAEKEK